MLINGGAVCYREGSQVSAAPTGRAWKRSTAPPSASETPADHPEYPPRTRESSKNPPFHTLRGGAGNLLIYIPVTISPPPKTPVFPLPIGGL